MERFATLVLNGINCMAEGLSVLGESLGSRSMHDYAETESKTESFYKEGKLKGKTRFSRDVLEDFSRNVGRFRAETGGMLASSSDKGRIDRCYFDTHSRNTPGSFYYDVESMSEVFRKWKSRGYITNGIYHSHPKGHIRPSYHDISSALLHIDFFKLDYFYLPIFQPHSRGWYTMYFYVVNKVGEDLEVALNYVIKAERECFRYIPFEEWSKRFSIAELRAYREAIDNKAQDEKQVSAVDYVEKQTISSEEYFGKVASLYPNKVLDKVIVCIGTGGARSFLENMARSGFRNFILMDADVISPSNIATQQVYRSEMGKSKVEVIRDKIIDINPNAEVLCINKFLDDEMSDEEFKAHLERFPGKRPTDYLILGCTDNFEAQKRSALLALKYGHPYMAAMMYKHGMAAEIIFVYPGVTESCPRCLLRDRFEKYENGYVNDVDSSGCPIFATERMNATKGYIALMMLMYHEEESNPMSTMLDYVKDRNFVEIRLNPFLKDSELGIGLFDRVFDGASEYVFFDETMWIPQYPDRPEFGSTPCRLCGGTGDLTMLQEKWVNVDTRSGCLDVLEPAAE